MNRFPHFFRWLGIAALLDWLVTRTLARGAIFMPKSAVVIAIYEVLTWVGQVASTAASLLALAALLWIAWQEFKVRKSWCTGLAILTMFALSLWGLFQPSTGWLAVLFQLLFISCLLTFALMGWNSGARKWEKISLLLVAATLLASHIFQLVPALEQAQSWEGPARLTQSFFNLGELLVLLSITALWWAFGRAASWKTWLAGAILTALFIVPRLLNPAMTGILAIWSAGLSLYLPWPLYALALLLACVTVITCLRRGDTAGWALLLLAAGGYAPQLSYQAFLGLVGLWLLANEGRPAEVLVSSSDRQLEVDSLQTLRVSENP